MRARRRTGAGGASPPLPGARRRRADRVVARLPGDTAEPRPRFEASRQQREEPATHFFAAVEEGDLQGLEELPARDGVLCGDGDGKAPTRARAIHGRARVARTLFAGLRAGARLGISRRGEEVNGQPGALFPDDEGRLISVVVHDVVEGRIQGVSSIADPHKLRHLGPLADLRALLRDRS